MLIFACSVMLSGLSASAAPTPEEPTRNASEKEVDELRKIVDALQREVADLKKQISDIARALSADPAIPAHGAPADEGPNLDPNWLAKNDGPGEYHVVYYGVGGGTYTKNITAKDGRDAIRQVKNMRLQVSEHFDGEGRSSFPEITKIPPPTPKPDKKGRK